MKKFGLALFLFVMFFYLGCALPKYFSSLFKGHETHLSPIEEEYVNKRRSEFDYQKVDTGLAEDVKKQSTGLGSCAGRR